jgi:hypothetical protein
LKEDVRGSTIDDAEGRSNMTMMTARRLVGEMSLENKVESSNGQALVARMLPSETIERKVNLLAAILRRWFLVIQIMGIPKSSVDM